ncbi:MAG: LamG domain protein jellyroll fold domain protein [Pedosphaera sp.]|nr:LamG domain protein jellyroll fold domain protein [Pedosphaera sp.]
MKIHGINYSLLSAKIVLPILLGSLSLISQAAPPAYQIQVLSDSPLVYYRLNDFLPPVVEVATNSGSLGSATDGTHFPGMTHRVPGAIVGDSDTAAGYTAIDRSSCDGCVPTRFDYNPSLNTSVFTVEAWLKPTIDGLANAQCPLYNRKEASPRTGWVFFQRPSTVNAGSGLGWNFRMYNGVDTSRSIDITGGSGYIIGNWYHVVATYDGSVGRLYVNGSLVASQSVVGSYAPNTDTIQFCIGGFFDATENPFNGSIDEVALYTNVLSPTQILNHYQNGTNPSRTTPYPTLITSDHPVQYLRLNEPAYNFASNIGSLGTPANAVYVNLPTDQFGPQPPTDLGFESTNNAGYFNGFNTYIEMNNPAALNFSGQVTVEAWVLPSVAQNAEAYMVAHGGNDTFTAEDALRIEGNEYQILSYNGVNHKAAVTIPDGDLGGGNWIHLVGTYDGANWNLYRNGILVSTTPDATGILPVANANWAIGARGRWKNGPSFPATGEDRQFNGGIDEVAIYNHALSANRVSAHYSAGLGGNTPITISSSGATGTLTWSIGTLQEATAVTGPYIDVAATSPYTPPAGPSKKFYRLKF